MRNAMLRNGLLKWGADEIHLKCSTSVICVFFFFFFLLNCKTKLLTSHSNKFRASVHQLTIS